MCIIIVKPAGEKVPEYSILKKCFIKNPDGAGLMFPDHKNIIIEKGFMTLSSLERNLESLDQHFDLTERDLCIHFRYATHGKKSPGNTHPFPITRNEKKLIKCSMIARSAIAHNGILYNYTPKSGSHLSDTMVFVKRLADNNDLLDKKDLLVMNGYNQKFCLMSQDNIIISGDFIYDSGIYYSNYGYQ